MVQLYDSGLQTYRDAEEVKRYDTEAGVWTGCQSGMAQKEGIWEEVWPELKVVITKDRDDPNNYVIKNGDGSYTLRAEKYKGDGTGVYRVAVSFFNSGYSTFHFTPLSASVNVKSEEKPWDYIGFYVYAGELAETAGGIVSASKIIYSKRNDLSNNNCDIPVYGIPEELDVSKYGGRYISILCTSTPSGEAYIHGWNKITYGDIYFS